MNMNIEDMDDVLVKYLLDEADATERRDVEAWIASGNDNKKYFEHFRLIWDESKKLAAQSTVDENAAWHRFQQRIASEQELTKPRRTIPFAVRNMLRIAAVLIVLLGCGAIYYFTAGPGNAITQAAGDKTMIATLPDGSVVTLNRNSSVTYPAKFGGTTRNVVLKGEGFFNVTPDKTKPFIIDAGNSVVKVVGTSFNVKTTQAATEVIVETGIVEVSGKQNAIRVMPHEKAVVYTDKAGPVKTANEDELYNYYRTGKFVCNGTSLNRLGEILGEAYDTHIVISDPGVGEKKISTTFEKGSLNDILDIIKATYGVSVEKHGNEIIIK